MKKLETIPEENRVWVDETGMDSDDAYAYGWSEKGERCHALKPGKSNERISVIAGLHNQKLVAPCLFECYTDADVFNVWLKDHLLPTLKPGMAIIMDNATFHKSAETKEIIEAAGCTLMFLPPYSPDFNPIEHAWFPLKNAARKIMQTFLSLPHALEAAILMNS